MPDHTPAPRRESLLAPVLDTLDEDTFHRIKATGIATGVVLARLFGATVRSAYTVRVRYDGLAGRAEVIDHGTNPQHVAVRLLATSQAASRALPANAHPLAAAAVEETLGQGNLQVVLDLLSQGYALWRRQAEIDAAVLLKEPLVWITIGEVADALISAGAPGLTQEQIESLVGDPSRLTDHQVWIPHLTDLP